MYQKLLIIIRNNQFRVQDISFRQFSFNKGQNLKIQYLSLPPTKMLQKPLFCLFKPPKEHGRHCHRYLGIVTFFWSIGSQKGAKNVIFLQGGHLKPPLPLVGLKKSLHSFISAKNIFSVFSFTRKPLEIAQNNIFLLQGELKSQICLRTSNFGKIFYIQYTLLYNVHFPLI